VIWWLKLRRKNGEVWEIEVEKDEYEDLGLEFEDPLISEARHCTNNCVFCFIDQLPRGCGKLFISRMTIHGCPFCRAIMSH
jgi:NifB/MoaA-like Fe-S oxidoreductase